MPQYLFTAWYGSWGNVRFISGSKGSTVAQQKLRNRWKSTSQSYQSCDATGSHRAQEWKREVSKAEPILHLLLSKPCFTRLHGPSLPVSILFLCLLGASDCHRRLWRWFPRHGGLCGGDESPVWVRGLGLCDVYRRPIRIHMVGFVDFLTQHSLLLLLFKTFFPPFTTAVFFSIHLFYVTRRQRCLLPTLRNFCAFLRWYEAVIIKKKQTKKKLWLISVFMFMECLVGLSFLTSTVPHAQALHWAEGYSFGLRWVIC